MRELGDVVVVAPDRDQSGVGTARTLLQALRVTEVESRIEGVPARSVQGTPADCVILATEELFPEPFDLLVSGINMIKKHQRPNPQLGVAGGIVEKEAPIQVSNVAIYNPTSKKADRVGFKVAEDGSKTRIFKSSGEAVDA